MNKRTYTHAVVHSILIENSGKPKLTDELVYAVDINHAHAITLQGLSAGWANVTIIELKEPTIMEEH